MSVTMPDDLSTILHAAINDGRFVMAVLSRPTTGAELPYDKVTVRPVEVRGETAFQFASRRDTKETHENLNAAQAVRRIVEWHRDCFADCNVFTTSADYASRRAKDGKPRIKTKPPSHKQPASTSHNREKQRLIPDGEPCPFLIEMGVMTPAGNVRAAKFHKFRQINRYLELVADCLPALPAEGTLRIVDFGCGKSYLTFALHHLLTAIHQREVEIVGLDRNEDVIRQCRQVAEKLNCRGLRFETGDIGGFAGFGDAQIDLVVSLHACDTATDEALAQALRWQAPVILAVPCCQHEIAEKMTDGELSAITRHGILKERFAAIATDALRADSLERHGYRTQVVEFIDMEHTAKNVLIRAIRRPDANETPAEASDASRALKALLGIESFRLDRDTS